MGRYQKESRLFQVLSHPMRLLILEALAQRPLCVCELVALTGHRQAYISQHLALLRNAELVSCERTGWNIYYRVRSNRLMEALETLQMIFSQVVADAGLEKAHRESKMNNKNYAMWHGIPRAEIDWHPTIISERCVGCGMCATSCGRGVYAFDYEQNRPVVVEPEMCMVGCTTCATICIQDAIEFPSTGYIRQLIRQKKLLRQAKDMLHDQRDQYDLRLHELNNIRK